MKHGQLTYTALAAAVALACGAVNAQDRSQEEGLEVEDRIEEVEDQNAERREDIAELEEADRERSEARAELDEELRRDNEEAREELQADRENAEEERQDDLREAEQERQEEIAQAEDDQQDAESLAQRREEIVQSADEAIEALQQQNDAAARLYERAYGYAVFDTTKGGLIVTGAGGTGVAREKATGEETFMHLGSAGVGLGAGLENYQLVMLFEDEQTYDAFVSGQWDGSLSAQAAVGEEGAATEEQFIEGIRAYRITDVGLMAQVDVSGTRFWVSDRLNEGGAAGGEQFAGQDDRGGAAGESGNPEDIDELAAEHDDLRAFFDAVKTAGLAESLTGDTDYTIFAPTNEAFESIQDENLLDPENREELISLLRAHIVADDVDEEMARTIGEASTIDGGSVTLSTEDDQLMVGEARVIDDTIERGNLRVYPIDGVLSRSDETSVASIDDADEQDDPNRQDDANERDETDASERASGERDRSLR